MPDNDAYQELSQDAKAILVYLETEDPRDVIELRTRMRWSWERVGRALYELAEYGNAR